jgi:hypothetical protein
VTAGYFDVTAGYFDVTAGYFDVTAGYFDVTAGYIETTAGYFEVFADTSKPHPARTAWLSLRAEDRGLRTSRELVTERYRFRLEPLRQTVPFGNARR